MQPSLPNRNAWAFDAPLHPFVVHAFFPPQPRLLPATLPLPFAIRDRVFVVADGCVLEILFVLLQLFACSTSYFSRKSSRGSPTTGARIDMVEDWGIGGAWMFQCSRAKLEDASSSSS